MGQTPTGSKVVGQRLREMRERSELKIAKVLKKMEVAHRTLYSWEDGSRTPPMVRLGQLLELYKATDEERLELYELLAAGAA